MASETSSRQRKQDRRGTPPPADATLGGSGLTDEQRTAVRHITSPQSDCGGDRFAGRQIDDAVGCARGLEAQGYRVHGAALAARAAESLTTSSGIAARTLASWEYGWSRGRHELGRNDILVIDEAGMVASRQLARFVAEAEKRGAKLVLVGDHEQLQAIGAGSPFRAIAERIGSVELTDIRRQKHEWQREASVAFATHRTAEGLQHYAERDSIRFAKDREQACAELIRDYLADRAQNPDGSRIALAHRRVDVRAINDGIRSALQAEGLLAKGDGQAAANRDTRRPNRLRARLSDRQRPACLCVWRPHCPSGKQSRSCVKNGMLERWKPRTERTTSAARRIFGRSKRRPPSRSTCQRLPIL